MKPSNQWFTLIEMLVAMTLLGIIMISVFTIFFLSNDINNKTDISRAMQENVKHIVETIAEDIRSNSGISIDTSWVACTSDPWEAWKICIGLNSYYLAQLAAGTYIRIEDISKCQEKNFSCILVKNSWDTQPLSNSWVEFENLEFTLFADTNPQKIQVNFTIRPSFQKWIKPTLIEENTFHFQTTLSKRIY